VRRTLRSLWGKVHFRLCRAYTWLLKDALKSCGAGVHFHFPVRLEEPGSISIGAGTFFYPGVWINPVSEWAGEKYSGEIQIGARVRIAYNVQISAAKEIVIEDDVGIAAGVVIVDHFHDHQYLDMPIVEAPLTKPSAVRIGKGSFLGVHCFIGPGVQVGEHSVVAANAVVINNVPSYAVAAGNPARAVRFHNPQAAAEKTLTATAGIESV